MLEEVFAQLRAIDPDWREPARRPALTLGGGLLSIGWAVASLFR